MLWDPSVAPRILRLIALPPDRDLDAAIFQLSSLSVDRTVLFAGGTQHLLIHDRDRSLQIEVSGANILKPCHLLVHLLPGSARQGKHEALLIDRFRRICRTGRFDAKDVPREPRGERLGIALQALDGWVAGASQRQIAIALLGERRVAQDWRDSSSHLRDYTRRAIGRGRWLMENGYRELLAG